MAVEKSRRGDRWFPLARQCHNRLVVGVNDRVLMLDASVGLWRLQRSSYSLVGSVSRLFQPRLLVKPVEAGFTALASSLTTTNDPRGRRARPIYSFLTPLGLKPAESVSRLQFLFHHLLRDKHLTKILIAGGGIGGLTLALALERRGLKPVILEQAPRLEEVGAGLQLSPNGTRALASLGLLDALRAVAVEPEGKSIRLWNTGETWPLFDLGPVAVAEYGFPYLMIHRGDLQATLINALADRAPGALRLGCKVVGLEQESNGVTALLADGSRETGAALIGADGVHSSIRSGLLGESHAEFTGCMAWRGVIDAARLPAELMRPFGVNWVGPGRHVITYPLRGGTLMNFVGVVESSAWLSESWTARGTREECAADFAGWHPDVHSLIDNVDQHFRWALLSRKPIPEWRIGRVALLGDACHPMLPFMAQGAVMAIEDAMILARCMAAWDEPEAALAAYVENRVQRTTRCVEAAEHQRVVFHNDKLSSATEAATYVETQWNEERVHQRYDWLFSYDVVGGDLAASD